MKSILISTLIVFFIVASSFQVFGEEWTAGQKEVWSVLEGHWESFKKKDIEAVSDYYHAKALDLKADNPTTLNKSQIVSANELLMGYFAYTHVNLKLVAINIVNNVANVFYIYKWESKNKELLQRGRSMTTMIKENNEWKIIGRLSASCDQKAPCPYGW